MSQGNHEYSYQHGEPVWARIKGYPWWPGRIVTPVEVKLGEGEMSPVSLSNKKVIEFFNDSERYAAVSVQNLRPYFSERNDDINRKYKGRLIPELLGAIAEADEYALENDWKREPMVSFGRAPKSPQEVQPSANDSEEVADDVEAFNTRREVNNSSAEHEEGAENDQDEKSGEENKKDTDDPSKRESSPANAKSSKPAVSQGMEGGSELEISALPHIVNDSRCSRKRKYSHEGNSIEPSSGAQSLLVESPNRAIKRRKEMSTRTKEEESRDDDRDRSLGEEGVEEKVEELVAPTATKMDVVPSLGSKPPELQNLIVEGAKGGEDPQTHPVRGENLMVEGAKGREDPQTHPVRGKNLMVEGAKGREDPEKPPGCGKNLMVEDAKGGHGPENEREEYLAQSDYETRAAAEIDRFIGEVMNQNPGEQGLDSTRKAGNLPEGETKAPNRDNCREGMAENVVDGDDGGVGGVQLEE